MKLRIALVVVLPFLAVLLGWALLTPGVRAVENTATCGANMPDGISIVPTGVTISDTLEIGVCAPDDVYVNGELAEVTDNERWNYTAVITEGMHSIQAGVLSMDTEVLKLAAGGETHNFNHIGNITTSEFDVLTVNYNHNGRFILGIHGWAYQSDTGVDRWDWTEKAWAVSGSVPWEGPLHLLSVEQIAATPIPTNTPSPSATVTVAPTVTATPTATSTPSPTNTPEPQGTLCTNLPFSPFAFALTSGKIGVCNVTMVILQDMAFPILQDPEGEFDGLADFTPGDTTVELQLYANDVNTPVRMICSDKSMQIEGLKIVPSAIVCVTYIHGVYAIAGQGYASEIDWAQFNISWWSGEWTSAATWSEFTVLRLDPKFRFVYIPLALR